MTATGGCNDLGGSPLADGCRYEVAIPRPPAPPSRYPAATLKEVRDVFKEHGSGFFHDYQAGAQARRLRSSDLTPAQSLDCRYTVSIPDRSGGLRRFACSSLESCKFTLEGQDPDEFGFVYDHVEDKVMQLGDLR